MMSKTVKKTSAGKSLCIFTNILNVKKKIAKRRIVAAKSKLRAMKVGTSQPTNKIKLKGNLKTMCISNAICMRG